MTKILVIKTGALGDVLRTTSILPGLRGRYREGEVTWVSSRAAADLVRMHPLVEELRVLESVEEGPELERLGDELAVRAWDRVLSFDDEVPLCALAARIAGPDGPQNGVLSGAYLDQEGQPRYTQDCAPWFDMGLLSVFGKEKADRLKRENRRSHPAIFAAMLGIGVAEPHLNLSDEVVTAAADFAADHALHANGQVVGLNTGAGGRWQSKKLTEERTVELASRLHDELGGRVTFLLLGGVEEAERNERILAGAVAAGVRIVDAGTRNSLMFFSALVDRLDLLVSSDSLALHVAIARRVPVVAFFAPTSAAEIELFGRGVKVSSTAPDYCSYRSDADTSTLTAARLSEAVCCVLQSPARS